MYTYMYLVIAGPPNIGGQIRNTSPLSVPRLAVFLPADLYILILLHCVVEARVGLAFSRGGCYCEMKGCAFL